MPTYQVSPSGAAPIPVVADNWLVALGLVLFFITFGVLAIARALLGGQKY